MLFGVPIVAMLSISILAYRYINSKYKDFYIISFILGFICIFMCTKFFPWAYMPQILTNIQFPWRLIGLAMFFFSFVMAVNVCELINQINKEKIRTVIYILVILIIGIFTAFRLQKYNIASDKLTDREYEDIIIKNPFLSQFNLNREYLPNKANNKISSYLKEREDRVYIMQGDATIKNETKRSLYLSFNISNAKNAVLELPYIFYPGYRAEITDNVNTKILPITESDNGFLQITIPDTFENAKVTIQYTGTLLEKASYIISLVSLIIFIVYVVYYRKKFKENYERKN